MKKMLVMLGALTVTAVYACYNSATQTNCPDTYTCTQCNPNTTVCNIVNFGSQYSTPADDGSGNPGLDSKQPKRTGDCTYDCDYGNGTKTAYGEEATGNKCNTPG